MRHDMGGEKDRRAAIAFAPHERFEPLLIDRVESRKRFVEHDQVGSMDDRADELNHLRHALRHLADLFVDDAFEPEFGHEGRGAAAAFAPVEPAQRAHESNRLARLHAGIESPFFGQIADAVAHRLRLVAAEQAARPFVGIDDAQRHAQAGGLARAIGTENAIDAPDRHL